MLILGLNAYHADSAACLVQDGEIIAAAEEERFRRIKHWAGLPTEAIRYCLAQAGVSLRALDHVAINRRPNVNNWRRLMFLLRHRPDFALVADRVRNVKAALGIRKALGTEFGEQSWRARFHEVEHHLAHLASASLLSPFPQTVCVSLDGFGDFASTAWGIKRGASIAIDGRIYFPHSLGIFYSAITQFLGFTRFGDEYKVMGLAPYGKPTYTTRMRELVPALPDGTFRLNLKYFRHHVDNVANAWNACAPEISRLYTPELALLLGSTREPGTPVDQRHKDLACSAQVVYEEALFALLHRIYRRYECPNLAVAGGCAQNSVANGKICLRSPFKRLFIPPAAGDAGGAVGAAFVVWQKEGGVRTRKTEARKQGMKNAGPNRLAEQHEIDGCTCPATQFLRTYAYTGPEFDDAFIGSILESRGLGGSFCAPNQAVTKLPAHQTLSVTHYSDDVALCCRAALALSQGRIVGWFQGRMEWGPRALGNRSILCDPRRAEMKDILNSKIKRRETFRPFAPSVLIEHAEAWFHQNAHVPFMSQVLQLREEKRSNVPAITHVDGSARLQTVDRSLNPLFWRLLVEFYALTSVPMLLNTSFNENEPIVSRPEEALACFLRTRMDVLVLGGFFLCRNEQLSRRAALENLTRRRIKLQRLANLNDFDHERSGR
jgi:carbamoyltransferase